MIQEFRNTIYTIKNLQAGVEAMLRDCDKVKQENKDLNKKVEEYGRANSELQVEITNLKEEIKKLKTTKNDSDTLKQDK